MQYLEDLERLTEHVKRLPDEIEWQRHEAEHQGLILLLSPQSS
jgi:hypothetical protein